MILSFALVIEILNLRDKFEVSLRVGCTFKKENMAKVYDLDDIMISPRIYETWLAYCPFVVEEIAKEFERQGKILNPAEIPNEQFREFADGTAEVFIFFKEINKEIKMSVPKGEWKFI